MFGRLAGVARCSWSASRSQSSSLSSCGIEASSACASAASATARIASNSSRAASKRWIGDARAAERERLSADRDADESSRNVIRVKDAEPA